MCGICGVVALDPARRIDREVLMEMAAAIRHRGPDDSGFYFKDQVGLASRRLSIIDLEKGKQPISNETGRLWIVFNGEIYNYQKLQKSLRQLGHTFASESDTEVILHLYEEYGPECLQHLNGIFSFAIWDDLLRELFLARDRLGVKPLYYAQKRGQLIFASELKAIVRHPEVDPAIDLISLNEYLSFEYVPTPRTIVKGVHRLPPGHFDTCGSRGFNVERFWRVDLSRSETRPPVNWRDFSANLVGTLRASVKQELVSDVPVGVLLSGGIDSSAIAAFMVEAYPGTVNSFSIGFEESSFDESDNARLVAEYLRTKHHELIVTSDMAADVVPGIMDVLDEPFGDSSFIPTLLVSKFASEHLKVVLGGDGGDEVFGGYTTLAAHSLIEYYERVVPRWVRSDVAPWVLGKLPVSFNNISFDFKLRRFLEGRGVPLQARHHRWIGSFTDEQKNALFRDWVKPVLRDTYRCAYRHARDSGVTHPLNQILHVDMMMYLEGDILFKVDRASMSASLEVRVPFLNRDLLDFATQLPLELKLKRLTTKYLLKKSMRGILPDRVINRPKKGFNMPVAEWLTSSLRELLLDMLAKERIVRQGFFDYSYIHQLLDDHFARRRDNRKLLWTLLMFQLWYQRYVEETGLRETASTGGPPIAASSERGS